MVKRIVLADYDINVASIQKKINEIKTSLKAPDLGKDFSNKFTKQLQKIEQSLLKVSEITPGSGATTTQINNYNKKLLSIKNNLLNFASNLDAFEISDNYLLKNIQSLQEYIAKLEEANKELKELKENSPSEYRATSKGKVLDVESVQAKMKKAAKAGDRQGVINAYQEFSTDMATARRKVKKTDPEQYEALGKDRDAVHQIEKEYIKKAEKIKKADKNILVAQEELDIQTKKASDNAKNAIGEVLAKTDDAVQGVGDTRREVNNLAKDTKELEDASGAFDVISNKISNLFSAANAFYLISRVIKGAIRDFQELDKQFNEIAIVSEYSTKEMWEQFSDVNKMAQEFGVTTKNVLEVQNLYYHQGKSIAEVNKLTAQTLTLAKITGMDYEKATSDLTAALNAYHIAAEDAVKITDTIAAMDTNAAISSEELMTALTKTASIAANAGMSLESTEVFLTKMIETTREAPENLGTALKTIIARFGEVKQEIDGEEIELADINRVDTALKSIGISLLDTAGQIRDLDDVFMELSSKWDDLDRNTQRYIATISAGSRQQSRFIAMMENYDRTLELTEIAQNSAGLGAKQLAKSQESIETSVNRLKSTWQEFYSKILTSDMIKIPLDNLNRILAILNKMPGPMGAIVAGIGIWTVKTKVLNKVLTAYKIINEGIREGLTQEKIVSNLLAASKRTEKKSLKEYISILKAYSNARINANTVDKKDATDPTVLLSQLAKNEALDENTREILKNTSAKISANVADKDAAIELATETLNQIAQNDSLEEHTRLLASDTAELIKNAGAKELNEKAGLKGTGGKEKIPKDSPKKKGGFLNTAISFITNPKFIVAIAAIGATIAATTAIYKKFIKASVDDSKQLENLQKARDKYNKTLGEYKTSLDNLEIVEKHANKTFKTSEEQEEEQSAIKELVGMYPYLLEKIDDEGNYHIKNTEAIRKEIDAKKELLNEDLRANNILKAQYARQGIYADESTRAGQAMSRMVSYYSVLDEDALDRVAESIDSLGSFNTSLFKEFANAYASGEKTSFSYKDMNNLFGHGMSLSKEQFDALVDGYNKSLSEGSTISEAFKSALSQVGLSDERLVEMWDQLNKQTGSIYSDLLSGIGEEIKEIYITEAKVFVEGEMKDSGANERVVSALERAYARAKVEQIDNIKEEEKKVIQTNATQNYSAITATGVEPVMSQYQAESYAIIANKLFGMSDEEIEQAATEHAEKYTQQLAEKLKDGENVKKLNEIFDKIDSQLYSYNPEKDIEALGLDDVLTTFLKEEFEIQQKEIDDIVKKINQAKEAYQRIDSYTWDLEALAPSKSQIRAIEKKYEQLGDQGGNRFLEGFKKVVDGTSGLANKDEIKNLYLGIDPTNRDSIHKGLFEMRELGYDTKEVFQDLINAAGGVNAFNFGDLTTSAEEASKKIEQLAKSIEGFMNLAKGSGTVSDVANLFDQITKIAKRQGRDVAEALKEATNQISYTTEGIQYGGSDSVDSAKRLVELQKSALMGDMQILQGQIQALQDIKERTNEQQKQLEQKLAMQGFNRVLYGEFEATYLRSLNDASTKKLEKQVEKLQKIRDAVKDIVTWLREYERYADLDAVIEDLGDKYNDLEFNINFSTNIDSIGKDLEEQVTNLNTQIAANQGGIRAAKSEQAMYRDILKKQNRGYVDFDAEGNLITNQEKLYKLQQEIMRQKKAGHDGTAEALENEYEQIMANIEGYRKAKEKVNEYSDALQENFEQLEEFLKANYDAITKIEDKLIEARQKAEDKELEIIKDKYDAIQNENNKYLENIQKMIDKERKIRDQANKEQDVKDKEKKLAMMKMDTSGIYVNEIKALEKELEGDYQSLEDDAVDKAIQDLEEQFNVQTEILNKEVEYLESALEYKREIMTEYNQWANEMLMQGSDTVLEYLKKNDEEYYTGTAAAQASWTLEWNNAVARGVAANEYMNITLQPVINNLNACKQNANNFESAVEQYSETAIASNGEVSATVENLTSYYTDLVDEVGGLSETLTGLQTAYSNAAHAANQLADAQQRVIATKPYDGDITPTKDNPLNDTEDSTTGFDKIKVDGWGVTNNANTWTWKTTSGRKLKYGNEDYYEVTNDSGVSHWVVHYQLNDTKTRAKIGAELWDFSEAYYQKHKFAKGGYVDYTGPAWVDGTKSHPEYMLNATQTQQFETLVAALNNLYGKGITSLKRTSQKIGDAIYNFHINVDQMSSDYDVDQLVSRLEQKMVDYSKYRNINILKKSQ